MVPLQGHEDWISNRSYVRDSLCAALRIPIPEPSPTGERNTAPLLAQLRERYEWAERHLVRWRRSGPLQRSLMRLQQLLPLSPVELHILEFAICMQLHATLREAVEQVGDMLSHKVLRTLALLLALPEHEVQLALRNAGTLHRSGLLRFEGTLGTLHDQLQLISTEFAETMAHGEVETQKVLRGMICCAPASDLQAQDFEHLQHSLPALQHYLRYCVQHRQHGANVLLYGPPGTGKTQLARLLAQQCDCPLFEVATQNCDGEPIVGISRMRAYRMAQALLGGTQSLLLFDEVDDVFRDSDFESKRTDGQLQKPWMNHALEHNALPTLWLCNGIDGIDPAYIRRFDFVLELPVPPQSQRHRIARAHCGDWVPDEVLQRLAQSAQLTPAVVARASRVEQAVEAWRRQEQAMQSLPAGCPAQAAIDCAPLGTPAPAPVAVPSQHTASDRLPARSKLLESLINHTLRAQGHRPLVRHDPTRLPEVYDPAFVHTDVDLQALADGIARTRSARLCLYGAPGTGKTAYARWLAKQLDMPLQVQRASDLMSRYVGATEANIATAFNQAEESGALLLIDEVDSFLQDRQQARHSWEVTAVNEMLTQMEAFAGVLVTTTNLMQDLDPAALRRFDLKARFDYLRPAQAWQLFTHYCTHLHLPADSSALQPAVARLTKLAPGDFAAVVRQQRFRPLRTARELLKALEAECRLKPAGAQAVGFV